MNRNQLSVPNLVFFSLFYSYPHWDVDNLLAILSARTAKAK